MTGTTFEIIPMSRERRDGKWIPAARVSIHDGSGCTEVPLFNPDGGVFDTKEEADAHSRTMGRRFLKMKGYI
jgi:hypothetical protein